MRMPNDIVPLSDYVKTCSSSLRRINAKERGESKWTQHRNRGWRHMYSVRVNEGKIVSPMSGEKSKRNDATLEKRCKMAQARNHRQRLRYIRRKSNHAEIKTNAIKAKEDGNWRTMSHTRTQSYDQIVHEREKLRQRRQTDSTLCHTINERVY